MRNKILTTALLLALSFTTNAGNIISGTKNDAGGYILLTDEPCSGKRGHNVLSTKAGGQVIHGCFTTMNDGGNVLITWYDGGQTLLNSLAFKTSKEEEEPNINASISEFAQTHEHFTVVRLDMAELLDNGLASDLEDAYAQAVRTRGLIKY
jgi:hypothetical protein